MEPLAVIGSTFGSRLVAPEKVKDLRIRDAELQVLLSRLEELRSRPRLPGINIICSCRNASRYRQTWHEAETESTTSSDSSGSESSSDQDDKGFSLDQVLKAIELYKQKPLGKRSLKTLRNLVSSYSGQHDIEDDQVVMVLGLMEASDHGLSEAAMLVARQLCHRESNAFKFLYHDAMKQILTLLNATSHQHLHEVAAQVIAKLASHQALADLWIDHMMTTGLEILMSKISADNSLNVRYACAQALSPLATHRNLAVLLTDQAMEVITSLKDINTDFKELYAEILTVLVQHTDHTRSSVLDIDALPAALNMLRQGPCGAQKQALVLLATLTQSPCGLKVILEANATQYFMSALIDSECRHVRCGAAEALGNLLRADKVSFQKQILVSIDKFFHDHEEGVGSDWGAKNDLSAGHKFRTDTATRITRAVEHLVNVVVKHIHRDARLETNQKGHVTEVHIAPGIDRDATCLTTLTLLVQILLRLAHVKVNPVTVTNFDLNGTNGKDFKKILRLSTSSTNPSTVRQLVDGGALCILDLLHAYTIKLHSNANVPLPSPGGAVKDAATLSKMTTAMEAWTRSPQTKAESTKGLMSLFDENELKLVSSLLELSLMFARSSCDNRFRNIQQEIQDRMEDYKNKVTQKYKNKIQCFVRNDDMCNNNMSESHDTTDIETCQCGKECRFSESYKLWTTDVEPTAPSVGNAGSFSCKCQCNGQMQTKIWGNFKQRNRNRVKEKCGLEGDGRNSDNDYTDIVYSETGQKFQQELNKQLSSLRRWLRIKLYSGGIVESVGPWLASNDPVFKSMVLEVMTCLVQTGAEFVKPPPAVVPGAVNGSKNDQAKTVSAMTSKECDKALNIALFQMSSSMNSLIKDALGIIPEGHAEDKNLQGVGCQEMITINENECDQKHGNGQPLVDGRPCIQEFIEHVEPGRLLCHEHDSCERGQADVAKGRDTSSAVTQNGLRKAVSENILHSVKWPRPRTELKTYRREDYDQFARKPSRPQSAKPTQTRPLNATVCKTTRPQSAKVIISRPVSAKVKDISASSQTGRMVKSESEKCLARRPMEGPGRLPRSGSAKCLKTVNQSPRFNSCVNGSVGPSSPNTPSRPSSGRSPQTPSTASNVGKSKVQVSASLRPHSGKALHIFGSRPSSATTVGSRPQSGKVILSSRSKTSGEKSVKVLQEITRRMMREGRFPWKPSFDACETLQSQTCIRVVQVCGRHLVADLLNRDVDTRRRTIIFLEHLVSKSQIAVHMKLSECSLMPRLVDFLRINDDNELVEVLGLLVARLLVASDQRLKELFTHHGGTKLLMGMASYSQGFLRSEVASTLKTITRNSGRSTMEGREKRRIMSAPVTGRSPNQPPDVWDKIMLRWQDEDRLMLMLRKKSQ